MANKLPEGYYASNQSKTKWSYNHSWTIWLHQSSTVQRSELRSYESLTTSTNIYDSLFPDYEQSLLSCNVFIEFYCVDFYGKQMKWILFIYLLNSLQEERGSLLTFHLQLTMFIIITIAIRFLILAYLEEGFFPHICKVG